jgi:hypothetical protein
MTRRHASEELKALRRAHTALCKQSTDWERAFKEVTQAAFWVGNSTGTMSLYDDGPWRNARTIAGHLGRLVYLLYELSWAGGGHPDDPEHYRSEIYKTMKAAATMMGEWRQWEWPDDF